MSGRRPNGGGGAPPPPSAGSSSVFKFNRFAQIILITIYYIGRVQCNVANDTRIKDTDLRIQLWLTDLLQVVIAIYIYLLIRLWSLLQSYSDAFIKIGQNGYIKVV